VIVMLFVRVETGMNTGHLAYFLRKLGCHGNSHGSGENSDSILDSYNTLIT